MAQTVFEQMGGSYVREGDYKLPAVTLPSEEKIHGGIWDSGTGDGFEGYQ